MIGLVSNGYGEDAIAAAMAQAWAGQADVVAVALVGDGTHYTRGASIGHVSGAPQWWVCAFLASIGGGCKRGLNWLSVSATGCHSSGIGWCGSGGGCGGCVGLGGHAMGLGSIGMVFAHRQESSVYAAQLVGVLAHAAVV